MKIEIWTPDRFPKRAEKMQKFLQMMSNRMAVGSFRHQSGMDDMGDRSQDYHKRLKEVIRKYEKTGNLENLVDAANYAMLLFYNPSHPDSHFTSQDSQGRTKL